MKNMTGIEERGCTYGFRQPFHVWSLKLAAKKKDW
jgi:hypothetical protein